MDEQLTTKRFLAGLSAKGTASTRSPFVIPALDGSPWFIELARGKRYDTAYIVYLGRSITVDDVLEKINQSDVPLENARPCIESVMIELKRFKIGNVLAVDVSDGVQIQLRLVSQTPSSKSMQELPE